MPRVAISASDIEKCDTEPIKLRIEKAKSDHSISERNSPLALPQDMGEYNKALAQLHAWEQLSTAERIFQLCFNYEEGSFSTH